MANDKAIYSPGELDKVKNRLGPIDDSEARRMQKILGGEVGRERAADDEKSKRPASPQPPAPRVRRTVGIAEDDAGDRAKKRVVERNVAPAKVSYFERVKMDSCCADPQFGIKTPLQALISKFSFFKAPQDRVNPYFVKQLLNEYYLHIQTLVITVRQILPKNNSERSLKLRKISLSSFLILDVFRTWKISQISSEISRLQARPRAVYAVDLQPILRDIYRPLFLLEDLSLETDIEGAFNNLYKLLFLESPTPETENERKKMTEALAAFRYIRTSVRFLLYPILMKNISDFFCSYDEFFSLNADKLMAFLGVSEEDKIRPASNKGNMKKILDEDGKAEEDTSDIDDLIDEDPEERARKSEEAARDAAEAKAVDKGFKALEALFPQANWDSLESFPDFFPYFSAIITFKKGCELISPRDPVQLALVLSAIIEEMLFGFRSIQFSGAPAETLNVIIDEWNYIFDESFYDAYLRRIDEYVSALKSSGGNTKSNYTMSLMNDIQWARRYYFFPLYDYKSGMPPSFSKRDIKPMFAIARRLRTVLTDLAEAIDRSQKAGGAATEAACEFIKNPWDAIDFQITNLISRRLDALLPKEQRKNTSLIFFTLAAATVLDNHLNSPSSIAYNCEQNHVFRSVNNEGRDPILWVDKRADVDTIFKESLKK
ncbi:MAG: hypothetical protein LBC77_07505 [Spirochaetaceae bacterium]|jgi:hypothetical protein|nr:hypothetical protein [Spirochaetaceae bacterium]